MREQLLFKLDQNPEGRGLRCDSEGLFLGRDALLGHDSRGKFEPRPLAELERILRRAYGDGTNWDSCIRSVELVANALNKGEMARAMMTAVLMRLPDPIDPVRIADLGSALAKAGFNPDEPRDERGRWTTGGANHDTHEPDRSTRIQFADAGISDASNDPTAQAAARAARSRVRPVGSEHEDFWETLVSRLSDEAHAGLSVAGQAELTESEAILDASTDLANTIVSDLGAYAKYRAQPWIGPDGVTVQVPNISTGDPLSDIAAQMGHDVLEPNAPLMRPGTNADWIDALVDMGSAATILAGPAFGAAGAGATAAGDTVEFAADAPFLIPPLELPPDFDITWPVGRYTIQADAVPQTTTYGNLVHEQIGKLVQDMYPDVKMILRTAPGDIDVDIEIPPEEAPRVGFRYAEIKPVSESGFRRLKGQIARWNKPEPVLVITYDYQGNIYFGFPW